MVLDVFAVLLSDRMVYGSFFLGHGVAIFHGIALQRGVNRLGIFFFFPLDSTRMQ